MTDIAVDRELAIDMLVPPIPFKAEMPAVCDAVDWDLSRERDGKVIRGPRVFKSGHCEKKAEFVGLSVHEPLTVRQMCGSHKKFLRGGSAEVGLEGEMT